MAEYSSASPLTSPQSENGASRSDDHASKIPLHVLPSPPPRLRSSLRRVCSQGPSVSSLDSVKSLPSAGISPLLFSVSSDKTVGPPSPVNAASSLPSNPSISPSGLTLLSVKILTDGVKLKSHLVGLKVPVLRQELKCRNIPLTGLSTKALLVSRLMELPLTVLQDPTSTTPKVANSILSPPSTVNCLPANAVVVT